MGGPIVRSYGVPGWDDIFGNKDDEKKENDKPKAEEQKPATGCCQGQTACDEKKSEEASS